MTRRHRHLKCRFATFRCRNGRKNGVAIMDGVTNGVTNGVYGGGDDGGYNDNGGCNDCFRPNYGSQ